MVSQPVGYPDVMSATPAPAYVFTEAEIVALLDAEDPGDALIRVSATRDGNLVSGEWWVPDTSPIAAKASTIRAKRVFYRRVSSVVSIGVIEP